MPCPSCQHENPDDARFCMNCAAALARQCASCRAELPVGARFCPHCAHPAEAPAETDPEPRSYTPKHLADKILTSRSALEGERKQISVLFADIKSSMELQEGVDPEEWHRIMDGFFQILAEGVHRFEGTVNQYTGDGIMALFGAPIAHEDHARRACYAALHLSDGLRSYATELRLERGLSFSVRMGINSGDVVVGKIGDDLRMDYTAQGHTVGLASRMQEIAEPGRVYLTENVARLVEGYFVLNDLGLSKIKGAREELRIHELGGVGQLRTRLDVSRARGFSRFVGRVEEMAILETALERAEKGNPQLIGIVGEAGVGKSRLCFEFLESCRARGKMTYETTGVAHGKNIPLLPMLRLFRAFFGITDQDSDVTAREKIAGRLLLLDEGFRETLPVMFDALAVTDPENPAPRMDPEARQRQLVAIVKGVLQARAERETTVALLEDLHWFDSASESFVEPLIEGAPGSRSLVILNFRPEYSAEWMKNSQYQQVPLLPLGPEALDELLADLLGDDPSLEGLAERIRSRTGGNPFFTEEVVQSLVESGKLEGQRGAHRLVSPVSEIAVPDSVIAVLAARIDRLSEVEKQVLQTAAVIGKTFTEPILAQAASLGRRELDNALHVLKSGEFIYDQVLYPVTEYAFKHPLTQKVALDSQLQDRRRRVHAAVAQAIEDANPDKLDEQSALLAYHWEEAGDALQASRWHARAARWAGATDAAESTRHWRSVHTLVEDVPRSDETLELGLAARTEILLHGWRTGIEDAEIEELFAEGEGLAEQLDSDRLRAELISAYALAKGGTGHIEPYLEQSLRSMREAEKTDDLPLKIYVLCNVVHAHYVAGRLPEALAYCEQALASTPPSGKVGPGPPGFDPGLWHLCVQGSLFVEMGRLDEAEKALQRSLRLAGEEDDADILAWSAMFLSQLAYHRGEASEALANARRAFELVEKTGSPGNRILAYVLLGQVQIQNEQWEEAIGAETEALEILARSGAGRMWQPSALAFLSEGHLGLGEHQLARSHAEEAIAIARRMGSGQYEVYALRARARALLAAGLLEDARADLDDLVRLIEKSETLAWLPRAHEARAELARLSRDPATREAELREAQRLFAKNGAAANAERVAALLAG